MADLMVSVAPGARPGPEIERQLREAIQEGRLQPGSALPSSRTLADDLGVARSTVVAAYEQLAVEGYLAAEQGRGTRVAAGSKVADASEDHNPLGPRPRFDFRPGEPASGSFPRRQWLRSMRRVIAEAPDDAFGYGDPRGVVELRSSVAAYLARARGVVAAPGSVRIYGGFTSALGFIGETLVAQGHTRIAVEQPMLPFHADILRLVGMTPVPVPVDAEGLRVELLAATDATAVLVTPSNQQPLGVTMTAERRGELIDWARANNRWIIEDDYDSEFRFDRRPIAAVQGLAADHVIYAGTASKALSPGLRLSWLIVPPKLRAPLAIQTHLRAGVSTIEQRALADFIHRGAYDRHIRQQRRIYRQRRSQAVAELEPYAHLRIADEQAGLHFLAYVESTEIERQMLRQAQSGGVGLMGLTADFSHSDPGIIINVSRPADHQFVAALDALCVAVAL